MVSMSWISLHLAWHHALTTKHTLAPHFLERLKERGICHGWQEFLRLCNILGQINQTQPKCPFFPKRGQLKFKGEFFLRKANKMLFRL